MLDDLIARGLAVPELLIVDGGKGLEANFLATSSAHFGGLNFVGEGLRLSASISAPVLRSTAPL